MIREVNIEDAFSIDNVVFIDVRSEKEFAEDTIPGAINIPILTNEEREYVGYLYKQVDREKAKEQGLEYASSKLLDFYIRVKKYKKNNQEVALFCYRGGMRSSSIASVLSVMGLSILLIKGGYKAYRQYVLKELTNYENQFKYIVIHGYTGVGKTKILKLLHERKQPVLDLEALAKNSGSVFGQIGYSEDRISQRKFETDLLFQYKDFRTKYIFIESESRRIGKITLPEFLHKNMENGYHVLIKTSLKNRVSNIMDDYINIELEHESRDKMIINAIQQLEKRLGKNKIAILLENIKNRDYISVIESLMLDYYDPLYDYSIDKVNEYDKIIEYDDIIQCVEELTDFGIVNCS